MSAIDVVILMFKPSASACYARPCFTCAMIFWFRISFSRCSISGAFRFFGGLPRLLRSSTIYMPRLWIGIEKFTGLLASSFLMPPIVIIGTVYVSSRLASILATASLAFALAVYVMFDARLCTSVLPTLLNKSFSSKDDPSNLIGSTLSV